jgi:superfamily I DNA/RNA helicase
MTVFIPEWGPVSGRELQLRRVLNGLGDAAVVRKPLHKVPGQPDYFIEQAGHGWLALTICAARFADICDGQLFAAKARGDFLRDLAAFDGIQAGKLVILWSCSDREAALLAQDPGMVGKDICLWSRDQFLRGGADALPGLMKPLSAVNAAALRRHYFPESEITTLNVGRRNFHRDNSAKLTGIFLDNEQEWATKLDLTAPEEQADLVQDFSVRLLNGVAGSGKTLVALQRAMLLAKTRPEQRVLILILNTPIVADLVERMHRSGGGFPRNLEMLTFAAWANRQWRAVFHHHPRMPDDPRMVQLLVHSLRKSLPPLRWSDQQLVEELDFLNDALITSEADYLEADRAGRGFALRENERMQVWALYQAVSRHLAGQDRRMWSAVPSEVCLAADHRALQTYDHILVDEAQFLAPATLQMVKLALRPGGSVFLCADPCQGFMRSRLSWKSVGLDIAGRTKKLRRSYRTTEALLRSATRLLARDVEDDPEDYLAPDYSGMDEGVPPILIEVATPQDAVDRVASEIKSLAATRNFPLSSILVMYGERASKRMLYERLCQSIGEAKVWWLNKDRKLPPGGYGGEHIRLASLDTATGLEGTFVFLVGVEALLLPAVATNDQDRSRETRARKLYMAMTRSCYRLSVVTTQPLPSELIENIFERRR